MNASPRLSSFSDLIRETVSILQQRIVTFLGILLRGILYIVVPIAVAIGVGLAARNLPDIQKFFVITIVSGIALMFAVYYAFVMNFALVHAAIDPACKTVDAYARTRGQISSYAWVSALVMLVTIPAFLFFVIPGLFVVAIMSLASFTYVIENRRGVDALARSASLAKGQTLGIVGRMAGLWIILALLSSIPVVGQVIGFLTYPVLRVFTYLIYRDLSANRAGEPVEKASGNWAVLAGVGAIALVVLMVIGVFGMRTLMVKAIQKFTEANIDVQGRLEGEPVSQATPAPIVVAPVPTPLVSPTPAVTPTPTPTPAVKKPAVKRKATPRHRHPVAH